MGELENGRARWTNLGSRLRGATDDIAAPGDSAAHRAAENLKHAAKDQAENAKGQIRSFAESGKDRLSDQLDHMARALRDTSDGLRGDTTTSSYSQVTDAIGDNIERASRYLRTHEAIDLVDEIETVARRQPLLFIGGAFAVGLAIGRFFKSSAAASETSAPEGGGGSDAGWDPGGGPNTGTGWDTGMSSAGGYPEPEQAITAHDTSIGSIPSDFAASKGASPSEPTRVAEHPIASLPGDDDEAL